MGTRNLGMCAMLLATLLADPLALLAPRSALACTTFLLQGDEGVAVGKSYDWDNGLGMVLFNKRGVAKQAIPMAADEATARWVSKYASLTFNQYGREMPNGGMNEVGLIVEVMWLNSASYPRADARPAINELQWIQYQLDNHADVAQVVAAAPTLRVSSVYAKVHYLACDAGGACAAFEYLDGKLVTTVPSAMRDARVLTNHTYAQSLKALRNYDTQQADAALPSGPGSLARFVRAASATRRPAKNLRQTAFDVLADVSQGDYSKWNIVYEPASQAVHFRTWDKRAVKTIRLDKLDGACTTPVKMLDMATGASGDVTSRLVDYAPEANRSLISRSLGKLGLPAQMTADLAAYPSALRCIR